MQTGIEDYANMSHCALEWETGQGAGNHSLSCHPSVSAQSYNSHLEHGTWLFYGLPYLFLPAYLHQLWKGSFHGIKSLWDNFARILLPSVSEGRYSNPQPNPLLQDPQPAVTAFLCSSCCKSQGITSLMSCFSQYSLHFCAGQSGLSAPTWAPPGCWCHFYCWAAAVSSAAVPQLPGSQSATVWLSQAPVLP